jgi:hypothetical protein
MQRLLARLAATGLLAVRHRVEDLVLLKDSVDAPRMVDVRVGQDKELKGPGKVWTAEEEVFDLVDE